MATAKTKDEAALPRIFTVRKARVVMDEDLARLYGVPTKRLNEAVQRNVEEVANLKSQIATSSSHGGNR